MGKGVCAFTVSVRKSTWSSRDSTSVNTTILQVCVLCVI